MSTTVKTTTTVTEIAYDADGRVIKETKTVTESRDREFSTGGWMHPPYGHHLHGSATPRDFSGYTATLQNAKAAGK